MYKVVAPLGDIIKVWSCSVLFIAVSFIATTACLAQDESNSTFFEKGFATTPFDGRDNEDIEGKEDYQNARDEADGRSVTTRSSRVGEFIDRNQKLRGKEGKANGAANDQSAHPSYTSDDDLKGNGSKGIVELGEDRDERISDEDTDQLTDASSQPDPWSIKERGPVHIEVFVSAEPRNHLVDEIKKVINAKNIAGVNVREVTVIGPPFSDPAFAKLLVKLNPKITPVKFSLELPKDTTFHYSPTWKLTNGSETVIFEGEFSVAEMIGRDD